EIAWRGSLTAMLIALGAISACSLQSANDEPAPFPMEAGASDAAMREPDASEPATDGGHDPGQDAKAPDAGPVPLPVPPAALVRCMQQKPYVEETCSPTTVAGCAHPAQKCSYSSPIGTLSVTVADPSASQVANWIVDAGDSIPAIAHLKSSDPASYLRALQIVATALMLQSGRIFPIQGAVGEDEGDGYYAYPFTKGVTTPCPTGEPHCYCRINSLSRGDYCSYRADQGKEAEPACRSRLGYAGGATSAWQDECIANHAAAWNNAGNDHIRAQVYVRLRDAGASATSTGAEVVSALGDAYGVSDSTVSSFCH
ncbi:MAG: hypothetical protein ABI461_13370, partial [Polyangiaceae bacterium]